MPRVTIHGRLRRILLLSTLLAGCPSPTAPQDASPSDALSPDLGTDASDADRTTRSDCGLAPVNPDAAYQERYRPQYHYSPAAQWMNDPNGLVYFQGEWHLFYQYNPDSRNWGNIHWGHAVSTDLVHWTELPVALSPDPVLGSVYSGSVVVDATNTSGLCTRPEGCLVAVFTHSGGTDGLQKQSVAVSQDRGRTWTPYPNNPVIPNPGGLRDFRDPKVFWHGPTSRWVMVLAGGDRAMLYASADLLHWTHLSDFGPGQGATGGVWECPDLFPLDVRGEPGARAWVLKVDVNPGGPYGGSGAQYFVGDFDGTQFVRADPGGPVHWVDFGADFYAAITWSDVPASDGRRLWVGWMNNWAYALLEPTSPWRGAMSLPRELSLWRGTDGALRLAQSPVAELQALRNADCPEARLGPASVEGESPLLDSVSGEMLELELSFVLGTATEFGVRLRRGISEETVVGYDVTGHRLFVDRARSGVPLSGLSTSRHAAPLDPDATGTVTIRLFVDRSSIEVFGNEGHAVITDQTLAPASAVGLGLYASGGAVMLQTGAVRPLRRAWP